MEDLLTKEKTEIKVPKMYNVILLNDDYTSIDFVISILVKIFGKNVAEAIALAEQVHRQGKGIAGTFTKDIAETKAATCEKLAKQYEYPLKLEVSQA